MKYLDTALPLFRGACHSVEHASLWPHEKTDGASGCNGEANVEEPMTHILSFGPQEPAKLVAKTVKKDP